VSSANCCCRAVLQRLSTLPAGSWPDSRYDMVLVFDRPSGAGPFTAFTQVPQMLLARDTSAHFE